MATAYQGRTTGFHRTLLAVAAALVAVAICLWRGHVQIVLGDFSTYSSVFEHRCGLLMILCVAWALLETLLYLRGETTRGSF